MASRSDSGSEIQWLASNEVLNRQVHPAQMKGIEPNYLAFRPMKSHQYTLSTTRQWLGPERSYRQHVAQELKSAGTWGISVDECAQENLDAFDDSALPGMPIGHVSIPFGIPPTNTEKDPVLIEKARALRNHAVAGGCLYRP
jgi:hypothetical protein